VPTGLPRGAHFGASCSMMEASRRPREARVADGATHHSTPSSDWAAADLAGGCARPSGKVRVNRIWMWSAYLATNLSVFTQGSLFHSAFGARTR
jgi:hypothetical protein